jgi:hypothetical protein
MRTIIVAVALAAAASGALAEQPQTRTFYNERGQEVGRATTRDGATTYEDAMGRQTGRAERRRDGTTIFYDAMGRQLGTARPGR